MRLDQQLQHQSLVRMLKESIYSMCRNSLAYDLELNVEGLIGITLDKRDVFLVNINESFQTDGQLDDAREKTNSGDTERNAGTPRKRKKRRSSASSSSEELERGATTSSRNYMDGAPARGSKEYPEEIDDCDAIVIKEEIESDEEKYNIPSGFNFDPAGHSSHMQSSMLPDYDGSGQEFSDKKVHWPPQIQPGWATSMSARQTDSAISEQDDQTAGPNMQATTQDSEEQVFKCRYCGRAYQSKTGRYLHEKLHNGQAFLCRQCGKAFSSRAHLQRHAVTHEGGSLFPCGKCSQAFTSRTHLNKHMFVHQQSGCIGEPPTKNCKNDN